MALTCTACEVMFTNQSVPTQMFFSTYRYDYKPEITVANYVIVIVCTFWLESVSIFGIYKECIYSFTNDF